MRELSYETYLDKTLGCWIGKSLGGIIGAPFEGHKIRGEMTAENCWPKEIAPNDDLDIQVVWLEALEERGPLLTQADLTDMWRDRCWYNFAEYGAFLYNVQRGIHPPLSGRFNNEFYRESMGCPIRAEIWGAICPGAPEIAAEYALQDGELDHIDNSVWAERFWAAALAEAYFAGTLEAALRAGVSVIPEESAVAQIYYEVNSLLEAHSDWRRVWLELIRRYGNRDGSKVQINFGFTLLSLYIGERDLKRTLVAAINYGWDSDCTAATAGALVGALRGAKELPEDWKERMGRVLTCDVAVKHKNSPLDQFAEDTCKAGLETIITRTLPVRITGVPRALTEEVERRIRNRPTPSPIALSVCYPTGPILYPDMPSQVNIHVYNDLKTPCFGELEIMAPDGVMVKPNTISLAVPAKASSEFKIEACYKSKPETIWDKNLFSVRLKTREAAQDFSFGLTGSRLWRVYGPYWDAWDTTRFSECPYRNDRIISHPVHIQGCQEMLVHEHARLDRQYLNEAELIKREMQEEAPFLVETGEDFLHHDDLGGFLGECCYYLTREIVSSEERNCAVSLGSTGPVAAWWDGRDVLRADNVESHFLTEHQFGVRLDSNPHRLVVKCLRLADLFQFSLHFIKENIPGDRTVGVSYFLDCTGGRL